MGTCFGTKDSQTKINLKHLIIRLKTTAPLQKVKLERKLQKDEMSLIEQFQKNKGQRRKAIQQCQIQQIVCLSNMMQIWGVLQNCCTKIIDYYAMLEDEKNITHIQKQIQILLFLKSILNNRDLDDIYKIIIRRYKINEPIMIENQVANYHKNSNSPDQKMRTQYIMNLCMNRQIQLAKINQVGHNFRYGM